MLTNILIVFGVAVAIPATAILLMLFIWGLFGPDIGPEAVPIVWRVFGWSVAVLGVSYFLCNQMGWLK